MKLWQKNYNLHKAIEQFTVGDDYLLDQQLLQYDLKVNLAHAKMLAKIGILTQTELTKIQQALNKIDQLEIKPEQEDVHTAVEEYLTKELGETGKKIHTARSRNDQVMADFLLYSKAELQETKTLVESLIKAINTFASQHQQPMPGYTHLQKAMPYSVDKWMLCFKAMLRDDLQGINYALDLIDINPLGSAAGYGLPLEIDKELTTTELGFKHCHQNALYVQNSKGKYETAILSALNQVMLTLNKLSTDLLLFTTSEFNYFSLPNEFCTGSSIMPQKKNYDVLELIQAKTKIFQTKLLEVTLGYSNLISGYNRASQLFKKPLLTGFQAAQELIKIFTLIIHNLQPNQESLAKALTPELYATEQALNLVKQGVPFREAYQKIGEQFSSI